MWGLILQMRALRRFKVCHTDQDHWGLPALWEQFLSCTGACWCSERFTRPFHFPNQDVRHIFANRTAMESTPWRAAHALILSSYPGDPGSRAWPLEHLQSAVIQHEEHLQESWCPPPTHTLWQLDTGCCCVFGICWGHRLGKPGVLITQEYLRKGGSTCFPPRTRGTDIVNDLEAFCYLQRQTLPKHSRLFHPRHSLPWPLALRQ